MRKGLQRKYCTYPLILLLSIVIYSVFASPLDKCNEGNGNPFLLHFNPALLCRQTGGPFGSSFYYNNAEKQYILTSGFIETFKQSGFSLCYIRKNYDFYNNISTAFSSQYKDISFGATFHFVFSGSEPLFTVDAGGSYHFAERRYIGIVVKNIFDVDTTNELFQRQMHISTGGTIPGIDRMHYTVEAIATLYNFKEREVGGGGDVNIHKFFFHNPSLSIFSRGMIFYNRNKEIKWVIEAAAGYHHFFNRFIFGVYAGYEFPNNVNESKITFSAYFNPQYKKNIQKLSCTINLSSPEITPNGDGINDRVIIDVDGIFSNRDVKTNRWNLIVKKDLTLKDNVIRIFSGGNIPPSSILWDGRDKNGQLVEDGTYYIQLFIVDTIDRVVSSTTEKIFIK